MAPSSSSGRPPARPTLTRPLLLLLLLQIVEKEDAELWRHGIGHKEEIVGRRGERPLICDMMGNQPGACAKKIGEGGDTTRSCFIWTVEKERDPDISGTQANEEEGRKRELFGVGMAGEECEGCCNEGDSGGGPNWFTATDAIPSLLHKDITKRSVSNIFLHFCGVGGYKMGTERDPLISVGQWG